MLRFKKSSVSSAGCPRKPVRLSNFTRWFLPNSQVGELKILRPYLIRQATPQQLIAQPGRWKIARQQAEEAVRLIQAGEINFEQAAQKYSRDPAAPVGGDYGYRTLSELPRELQGVISQSTKNQLSAPQRTAEGFYVVSLIERVSGGLTSDDRYHVQMIFVPPIVKFDEIMRVEIEQIH